MLGGACVVCGATEHLHFDHIDPTTKRFNVSARVRDTRIADLIEETLKCQLLCRDCHAPKTAVESAMLRTDFERRAAVMALKQRGLTNREIGMRLGLPPSTVGWFWKDERRGRVPGLEPAKPPKRRRAS